MLFAAPCIGGYLLLMAANWALTALGWMQEVPEPFEWPFILGFSAMAVLTMGASVGIAIVVWIRIARHFLSLELVWSVVNQEPTNPIYKWLGQYDRRIVEYLYGNPAK